MNMNGYQFQADAYRKYLEQHPNEENKESIEKTIKVNEILAICTKEEIEELYNTGTFNEITKAYAKKAMQNLGFQKKEVEAVQDEIKWLHDTIGAGML